ncbi:MAG: GAF domain-containing sensor histidine kinase [Chloroflexi bacterium]|nr:GAF domain-containing sensor histidine kinase [Chloroflexota bacterium]
MTPTLEQLARLVEISLKLNSTLDSKLILQSITEIATEVLECEAVSVLLFDKARNELRFATSSESDREELAHISVPLNSSIAGSIYLNNQPQIINNPEEDPRHFQRVGEEVNFQSRSLVGVPMRVRDKVTGVLEGLNKKTGGFTQVDVDLLSVIASQAAVAINNAQLVESLRQAYDELSKLDKIKSDFIAIASHELRTPLGVILGYAQFLQEESKGKSSEHASRVVSSALQIRALVEDMTNLSMLQMGSLDLTLKPIEIQSPLTNACEEVSSEIKGRQHSLVLNFPETPILVRGDSQKLERVFVNLLSNAARFTHDGGVIKVNLNQTGDDVLVEIQDNGIGIPPRELENVFKDFYQTEDHMTRSHGGMGLGLTIAQGLVKLHQGKIWAESEGKDKGTKMSVVLPVA